MTFLDSVAQASRHLGTGGDQARQGTLDGFGLAMLAWTTLADADQDSAWDLFGLEMCAAADLLGIAPTVTPTVAIPTLGPRSPHEQLVRLVNAMAAAVESDAMDLPLADQLQRHAAGEQLRRAGAALS